MWFFLKSNSRFPSNLDRFLPDRQSSRDNSSNFNSQQQLFGSDNSGNFLGQQMNSVDRQQQQQQDYFPFQAESNRFRDSSSPSSSNQPSSMKVDSFVFNIEGLSSPMWNCERVFNLLCLYGNVLCVKKARN